MKRIVSLVICTLLVLGLFSTIALAEESKKFDDVPANYWAADYINALVDSGVLSEGGKYYPQENITRRHFAAYLTRALKLPASNLTFSDVAADSEYAKDISAAVSAGLIFGIGNNKFAPEDKITRQDAAVIVARAIGRINGDAPKDFYTTQGYYRDAESVSVYAKGAILLMSKYGVITGKPDFQFDPKGNLTRAEAAAIISRLLKVSKLGEVLKSGTFVERKDDKDTVALWLFDELTYDNATLTNASLNEDKTDLVLLKGGDMIPGKYGRALSVNTTIDRGDGNFAVCFASFTGSASLYANMREIYDDKPSGLWGPTETPLDFLDCLTTKPITFEFWFKSDVVPTGASTFFAAGYGYDEGYNLTYDNGKFVISNYYNGYKLTFEAPDNLFDGQFKHIAFTSERDGRSGTLFINGKHYSDGKYSAVISIKQPPLENVDGIRTKGIEPNFVSSRHMEIGRGEYGTPETRRPHRFNVSIGSTLDGKNTMVGTFDEMCISRAMRYNSDFGLQGTFSTSYSEKAYTGTPNTEKPLLFSGTKANSGAFDLTGRKFVFIDDALTKTQNGMEIVLNKPELINLNGLPDPGMCTIIGIDGKVYAYLADSYAHPRGDMNLYISSDGINFEHYGAVLKNKPLYGEIFVDTNPACPPSEKYKFTCWLAARGIYMFTSPDGINFRRSECSMLPLLSGGSAETYYDDQRGVYTTYIKRDSSYENEPEVERNKSR